MEENNEKIGELTSLIAGHIVKMEPVYEAFTGLTWTKKFMVGVIVIVGSVVSLIIAFKELFKK